MADHHLVVTSPFGEHAAGDWITDDSEIDALLVSHPTHVVRARSEANPDAPPADELTAPIALPDGHGEG